MPFNPPISSDKFGHMQVVDPVHIPVGDPQFKGFKGQKSLGIASGGRRGLTVQRTPGLSRGRATRGTVKTPSSLRTVQRTLVP